MTLQDSSCFSMIFLQIMSLSSKGSYGELYVRPYSTRLPIFFNDFWAVSPMIGHFPARMDGKKCKMAKSYEVGKMHGLNSSV